MRVVQNIRVEMSEAGRARRQGGVGKLNGLQADEGRRSGPRKESRHDLCGFKAGGVIRTAQEDVETACAIERSLPLGHDSHRDPNAQSFRHTSWRLPLFDRERFDRVAVGDRPKESLAGFPRVAKVSPDAGPPEATTGKSQVGASCQKSDACAHPFNLSRFPRDCNMRTTHDGAAYSCETALPTRAEMSPESGPLGAL